MYGFQGVTSAVVTGRTLNYVVRQGECESLNEPKHNAEYEDIFGGHVTTWRSFNDRDISDLPFVVFYDQKMLFVEKGQYFYFFLKTLFLQNPSVLSDSQIILKYVV